MTRERAAFLALAAFTLVSLVGAFASEARKELDPHRISDRYAHLVPSIPEGERAIGFVSDAEGELRSELLFQAQYALAPRTVADTTKCRFLLGTFLKMKEIDEACARSKLKPVIVLPNGVALFESSEVK